MESMSGNVIPLAIAALIGAIIQELAWWYDVRHELTAEKYASLIRSTSYWVVVVLMVLASSIGPVIFHWGRLSSYSTGDFMIFGAAFPLIFKQLTGSAARQVRKTSLGPADLLSTYLLHKG